MVTTPPNWPAVQVIDGRECWNPALMILMAANHATDLTMPKKDRAPANAALERVWTEAAVWGWRKSDLLLSAVAAGAHQTASELAAECVTVVGPEWFVNFLDERGAQ